MTTSSMKIPVEDTSQEDLTKQTSAVEKLLQDTITEKLPEYKDKIYSVGGFVRDQLMGHHPKDIDIVVDDPESKMKGAEEFSRKLVKALNIESSNNPHPLKEAYGIWGVALLNPKKDGKREPFKYNGVDISGYVIELTPPREEGPYDEKKRAPEWVRYTSIDDDARRRDLTINAIYKNLATGKIEDPVGGKNDLKAGILKAPEHPGGIEHIYEEDPLRILRIVRFGGKTGFKIDSDTLQAIKKFLSTPEGRKKVTEKLSKERIIDELEKIITGKDPAQAMEQIKNMGFLDFISPELSKLVDIYHDTKYHKGESVWKHTMDVINKTPPTLKARLSALFHDIGKIETQTTDGERIHFYQHEDASARLVEKILRELKAPLSLIKSVRDIVHSHMGFKVFKEHRKPTQLKNMRILIEKLYNDLDDALALMKADAINEKEEENVEELKRLIKTQKEDDIKKGILVEKGGKIRYESPISGDLVKDLQKEFEELADDRVLGAILGKLKQMTMSGHFDDPDKEKRIQKARVLVRMFVKDKKQLESIIKNWEEEKKSGEFFKSRKARIVLEKFISESC